MTECQANQLVQYLHINLTDGAAPYTDIGLLVAGQLWRLQRGTAYGIREGRVMLDRRDRNPFTGAEFPVPAIINPRFAAFTLPALSLTEARNQHRDLLRQLGAAGEELCDLPPRKFPCFEVKYARTFEVNTASAVAARQPHDLHGEFLT